MSDHVISDIDVANKLIWGLVIFVVLVVLASAGDHIYLASKLNSYCDSSAKRTQMLTGFLNESADLQTQLNQKGRNAASFWDGLATKQSSQTDPFPLFLQSDAQLQRDFAQLREQTSIRWRTLIKTLPPIKDC